MFKIKILLAFGLSVLLVIGVAAQSNRRNCPESAAFSGLKCDEFPLLLADTEIPIRVYSKGLQTALDRTFVVTHNNEQKGLNAVKEVFAETGISGRLVEVVSNYEKVLSQHGNQLNFRDAGNEGRYLHFGNGNYCLDPNRIYSEIGRLKALKDSGEGHGSEPRPICPGTPTSPEMLSKVKVFADNLIKIITQNGRNKLIIGVHNNTNEGGLSLNSYREANSEANTSVGVFSANNHPDKKVTDTDDFILVSDIFLFVKIFQLEKGFNIALQENRKYLKLHPETDDGSMSIYFGKKVVVEVNKTIPFRYLNIEAEGKKNIDGKQKERQKEAIRSVIKMRI